MASQIVSVSGNRRLRPDQTAAMNARLQFLPQMLAQKESSRQRQQDIAFRNQQFEQQSGIARDQLALQEKAQRQSAGVSALNLGLGVAGLGNKSTLGSSLGNFGSSLPSGIGGLKLGGLLGAGLAGFGASQFAGGSKGKKALFGAGAGALMNMFTGGGDNMLSSGLSGALFGGLGGLFG